MDSVLAPHLYSLTNWRAEQAVEGAPTGWEWEYGTRSFWLTENPARDRFATLGGFYALWEDCQMARRLRLDPKNIAHRRRHIGRRSRTNSTHVVPARLLQDL